MPSLILPFPTTPKQQNAIGLSTFLRTLEFCPEGFGRSHFIMKGKTVRGQAKNDEIKN
jgi:hypothetical protein